MIVAMLSKLTYVPNARKHTVYYAENCQKLNRSNIRDNAGTFKAVIAKDEGQAIDRIRAQVREYLRETSWLKPQPEDFVFEFQYSEVKDGEFWLMPSTSNCKSFYVNA